MSGLIDAGRGHLRNGMYGMQKSADLERQRQQQKKHMDAADKATTVNSTMTGAGMGAMAGAKYGSAGGPWGAVIGAAVGFLASKLF